MKTIEDILLYIFLLLALIFLISGCTPIYISPSDDIYFHDQFNRSHPNPIPLPPTPRKIQ